MYQLITIIFSKYLQPVELSAQYLQTCADKYRYIQPVIRLSSPGADSRDIDPRRVRALSLAVHRQNLVAIVLGVLFSFCLSSGLIANSPRSGCCQSPDFYGILASWMVGKFGRKVGRSGKNHVSCPIYIDEK